MTHEERMLKASQELIARFRLWKQGIAESSELSGLVNELEAICNELPEQRVKCSERMPTEDDADCDSRVWWIFQNGASMREHWRNRYSDTTHFGKRTKGE